MTDKIQPSIAIDTSAPAGRAAIEVGWVICQPAAANLEAVASQALNLLGERLESLAPGFSWQWRGRGISLEQPVPRRIAVMALIESGIAVLDTEGLDFVFVLTDRVLEGSDGQPICAGSSSAAGISVISIDPFSEAGEQRRAASISALAMHLFGHMVGLDDSAGEGGIMDKVEDIGALSTDRNFSSSEKPLLVAALSRVADMRVEERGVRAGAHFYIASAWENWREILRSIARVRPWLIPLKLSRLTAAAASALFVLIMTAEVWELGMAQSPSKLLFLSVVSLVGTSIFVLLRQHLLVVSGSQRLTEQIAVMRLSITLGVICGMLSTYLVLFTTCYGVAYVLFPTELAARWSAPGGGSIITGHSYLRLAAFVSAFGVFIGALGASFERQDYLKQLALLDREIRAGT